MERVGLADLRDIHGNLIDVNNFSKLETKTLPPLIAKEQKEINNLPEEYKGKTWNELYLKNQLEFIRDNYPHLFEKLKNGTIKTL